MVMNRLMLSRNITTGHSESPTKPIITLSEKNSQSRTFRHIEHVVTLMRPPLLSSGQSSWLQIRRPRFDSRHYQKKKVVGLERGPLSLMSRTEELLDRKVATPV
jgi:hypothetical protein